MDVRNPYQNYQQQGVMTATPGELVVMLYDGCIKQLRIGATSIEKGEYNAANTALQKAENIIAELSNSLDMRYELSTSLSDLYEFYLNEIISANMTKNASKIQPVVEMMQELREAWAQAVKITRRATIDTMNIEG